MGHGYNLTKQQVRALEMQVEGYAVSHIAEHLGVSRQTLYNWREKGNYQRRLQVEKRARDENTKAKMHEVGHRAIEVLDTIANDDSIPPQVRVSAASKLIDGMIKVSGLEAPKTQEINVNLGSSDGGLAEFMGSLESKLAAIPATLEITQLEEPSAEDAEETEVGNDDNGF